MEFFIDLTWLENLGSQHPFIIMWKIFINGGWILVLMISFWGFWQAWMLYIKTKYHSKRKFCLLAIDVPKNNEQTPKAVEHIFSHLHGSLVRGTLWQRFGKGKHPNAFSLEIISVGGYIQFLIYTNEAFRDLVEAAVYAQYPDAEITEVEEYTENAPLRFPDEEYYLWGTEFILAKQNVYPIKLYSEFEHPMAEEKFKDPMAALLELLSKLQSGEQIWLQWVITPIGDSWRDSGEALANKLAGKKVETKGGLLDTIIDAPLKILGGATDIILGQSPETVKKEEAPSKMLHLTPGEKNILESIQQKTSKIAFKTKFRVIYISPHEKYSKSRGVAPVMGAIKQFNTINLNSFKLVRKIKTDTFYIMTKKRTEIRQNKIMKAFRARSTIAGWGDGSILNIEELATLWHFPIMTVKAPLLKKVEAKRAEPPFSLPLEEVATGEDLRALATKKASELPTTEKKAPQTKPLKPSITQAGPPANLPTV